MNILLSAFAIAMVCALYFGVRAILVVFRSIAKLGQSRSFGRMTPDQQLHAFFQAPAGDRRFRRFLNRFFGFVAIGMFLLGVAAPQMPQNGKPSSRWPLFLFAAVSGLLAAGGAAASRNSVPGIGAFCQCASCGRKMRITGMPQLGGVMMSREEMWSGMATAELCRECGRIYCDPCYHERAHQCECGRGRNKVIHEFGARYRGPIRLVKVQYQ